MNSIFKDTILLGITQHEASRPKRRPPSLDPSEAIDCLFKLVRTGMQWRELQPTTASYITVFKHTRRWIQSGIVHDAYACPCFRSTFGSIHRNITLLTRPYVKNAFGRVGVGRNPVDRGRKALKISALTDQDGIVHNLRCDPANTSGFRLFAPMLSSMLINLRRIEVFADRGYDSRRNRAAIDL